MTREDLELDALVSVLGSLGAGNLPHMTGHTYVQHCSGVYRGLLSWGLDRIVARAGFFHSIYGTERFKVPGLPVTIRVTIRGAIGSEAEALAYAHCAIRREDLDRVVLGDITEMVFPSWLPDGGTIRISDLESFRRLIAIHLADWLDQVPLCEEWNYRYPVYRRIAEMLGDRVYGAYSWVYRGR